jgi:hypothetical protein
VSHHFRLIPHTSIDFTKWDRCVTQSTYPSVFASSYYLTAVSPGWDALVKGDYETIFPVTKKRKLGYTYLPHPPFTGQLGLFGKFNIDTEKEVLAYLQSQYRLIEIELNCGHNLKSDNISEKCTHVIDYTKHFEYNENTQRNIKRALKLGLQVEVIEDKTLLSLSKKHLDPFITGTLKINSYGLRRFHELLKAALKHKQIKTYCTKTKHGEVLALAHFIYNKHQVIYLKGSNFDKEANSGSMHLLMSRAIEDFKKRVKVFDFSGGSIPNIARFFKGLGGEPLYYPVFKYNTLPGFIKLLKSKSLSS